MNVISKLDAVTLYREGAICERRARLDGAENPGTQLCFVGLPLSLAPGSLRGRILCGPQTLRVTDVRAGWDVQLAEEIDAPAEQKALLAARDEAERLRLQLEAVDREVAELKALRPAFPKQERGSPPREAPVAALVAMSDFVDQSLASLLERRRCLTRELEDADEAARLRERRLQEAGTAKRTERSRLSRSAVLTLSEPVTAPIEIALEYHVPGARWAPGYQLRLEKDLGGGTLRMRAIVGQNTGEDWTQVRLALSTASLERRTDVPELKMLKIGRAQPPPRRSGWREPPPGLDDLFAAYDDAFVAEPRPAPSAPPPTPPSQPPVGRSRIARKFREERRGGRARIQGGDEEEELTSLQAGGPPPQSADVVKGMRLGRVASRFDEYLAAPAEEVKRPSEISDVLLCHSETMGTEPGSVIGSRAGQFRPEEGRTIEATLLDYDRLSLSLSWSSRASRGRLKADTYWDLLILASHSVEVDVAMTIVRQASSNAMGVSSMALPGLYQPVQSLDSFDYRYDCEQQVDVPSTGKWVTVPVMSCSVGLEPKYVCVPAVEPQVYRILQVKNTSSHALLAGPVDVTAGDDYLLTASLPSIPPGSEEAHLGLGVEESIKVARKTHYREVAKGVLVGGSTLLAHEVEIEINNRLSSPARLEVRERVPVAGEDMTDIVVEETDQTPAWEKVETPLDGVVMRGLRRWRVTVAEGQRQTLTARYNIRIPANEMLVGGNRRA